MVWIKSTILQGPRKNVNLRYWIKTLICVTDFFWKRKTFFCFYGMWTEIYEYSPPQSTLLRGLYTNNERTTMPQFHCCIWDCLSLVAITVHWSFHCLIFIPSTAAHGVMYCAGCSHLKKNKLKPGSYEWNKHKQKIQKKSFTPRVKPKEFSFRIYFVPASLMPRV